MAATVPNSLMYSSNRCPRMDSSVCSWSCLKVCLTAKIEYHILVTTCCFGRLLSQGFRFSLSVEYGMTMNKGHSSVPLYLKRNSLRMRALSSDRNRVVASFDALSQKVSLGAPRVMLSLAPLVDRVDHQGCGLFDTSLDAMLARLRELGAPTYSTKRQLWLRLCDHELTECERKTQDAS